jgi:predicted dehydrogenase
MHKKTVRAGIVGAGFAARFHFEALQKIYGTQVEVKGVYSPQPDGKVYANERGISATSTLDELLDNVDVVHVCTPPSTHEAIAVAALKRDIFPIVEKPLTGFFGDGTEDFNATAFPKQKALDESLASIQRLINAEKDSQAYILYAENWVYAPSIQKEKEIIEKTGSQILWMRGEEAHSGSHAHTYGFWKFNGGGTIMGKACHPLTAALYLKRVEGMTRNGHPIRPRSVSARTHTLTHIDGYRDEGHIRTDYFDVEDFGIMHVVFEDGTVADIVASEIVLGGVHNWLEVVANNHRTTCNINPNTAMQTYNPVEENFKDIYVVEKTGTKQGWSTPSPDEDWFTGYQQEMEAFYQTVAYGTPVESNSGLAADCISTIYSAYLSAEKKGAEVDITTI